MVATPITPQPDNFDGQIVTIMIDHISTGVVNTVTIPAGMPYIELTEPHPIISLTYVATEASTDVSDSVAYTPANEMARGTNPDGAGEWMVNAKNSVKVYTVDKNGFLVMCYRAKGVKLT